MKAAFCHMCSSMSFSSSSSTAILSLDSVHFKLEAMKSAACMLKRAHLFRISRAERVQSSLGSPTLDLPGTSARMAKWLKATLFGRQLSHGSDKDSPETFSEALQGQQSPFNFEGPDPYMQQQQTVTPSGLGAVGPSPGASEMKAAYTVSTNDEDLTNQGVSLPYSRFRHFQLVVLTDL